MNGPAREKWPGERASKIIHVVLLAALGAGIGAWLWKTYGFEPLRVVEPPAGRAAR